MKNKKDDIISLECSDISPNGFIQYRRQYGSMPVVLTAPHGGSIKLNNKLLERPKYSSVNTKSDLFTIDLLVAIDRYINMRTDHFPYCVFAHFHRKYIDANRDCNMLEHAAYHPQCRRSRSIYDSYHDHIERCVAQASLLKEKFSQEDVLLLDIHGMKQFSDFMIIGTKNGTTGNLDRLASAYSGFLWNLRYLLGDSVLPGTSETEYPMYMGGHTVAYHGKPGVNAIQLEFGGALRGVHLREAVAVHVGEAITRTMFPLRNFVSLKATQLNWNSSKTKEAMRALEEYRVISLSRLFTEDWHSNEILSELTQPTVGDSAAAAGVPMAEVFADHFQSKKLRDICQGKLCVDSSCFNLVRRVYLSGELASALYRSRLCLIVGDDTSSQSKQSEEDTISVSSSGILTKTIQRIEQLFESSSHVEWSQAQLYHKSDKSSSGRASEELMDQGLILTVFEVDIFLYLVENLVEYFLVMEEELQKNWEMKLKKVQTGWNQPDKTNCLFVQAICFSSG